MENKALGILNILNFKSKSEEDYHLECYITLRYTLKGQRHIVSDSHRIELDKEDLDLILERHKASELELLEAEFKQTLDKLNKLKSNIDNLKELS